MSKILKALCLGLLTFTSAHAEDHSPTGYWLNGDKKAVIEVYNCGSNVCGKIVSLREPIDPETKEPKLDKHNPEESLRKRPLIGLEIMSGVKKKEANEYDDGKIYDPKEGKSYDLKFTMKDKNTMDLRGYMGLSILGRTQTWTRQSSPDIK